MLCATLNESLPQGVVAAKYRLAVQSTDDAARLYDNLLHIRADFQLIDVTARECSRLVAAHCVERAAAIEMVRCPPLQACVPVAPTQPSDQSALSEKNSSAVQSGMLASRCDKLRRTTDSP